MKQMVSQIPDEDPNFGGVPSSPAPPDKVSSYGAAQVHPAHRAIENAMREVAAMKVCVTSAQALVLLVQARDMIQRATMRTFR